MKQHKKHLSIVLLCLATLVALCLSLVACHNKTYTVTIAEYDKAQGTVTLSPEPQDGKYKEGTEITVTVTPADGYAVESFRLGTEDKSSDLNNQGKFTFTVEQDTTITVTFKSTTVAVKSVSLNKQSLIVHITKQDASLTAQVLPDNATDKTVTWTSSVPEIATVDSDGKITAVAAGETIITATAGGKSATCTVTVTDHELTTVSAGENGHKSVCGVEGCGYESAVTAHSLKINSDKTKFECEQCDYQENHTHTYKIVSDAEQGHHQECENEQCGFVGETVAHQFNGEYYSDGKTGHHQECSAEGCGYHTQTVQHTFTSWEISTENAARHESYCDDCDEKTIEDHKLVVSSTTATEEIINCEKCTFNYTFVHKLRWIQDEDGKCHQECENTSPKCNYKTESQPHDMQWNMLENAAEGHSGVCKNGCGYVVEQEEHDKLGEDGACSKCNYKDAGVHVCEENLKIDAAGYYDGECSVCHKNLFFTVDSNGIITKFDIPATAKLTDKKIKIPEKANGVTVVNMGAATFASKDITAILIPETVTTLTQFINCQQLKTVIIKAKVSALIPVMFQMCYALTDIVLPETLTSIPDNAFAAAPALAPSNIQNVYFMGGQEAWTAITSQFGSSTQSSSAAALIKESVHTYFLNAAENGWKWQDDEQEIPGPM